MHTIQLANGKQFTSTTGQTVLAAADAAGLKLEYSCQDGRCGQCKVRVLEGQTQALKPELYQPLEEGCILSCCRAATSDLTLDAEDLGELAEVKTVFLPARIDQIEPLSEDIRLITLRTPPKDPMRFLAGQYVVVQVNGHERSYSFANAPQTDGKLRLLIRRYPNGILSEYWFNQAKVNDLLRIKGPMGTFFLRSPLPAQLLLVATGTGMAPLWSLLEKLSAERASLPNAPPVTVLWGNRSEVDFCLPVSQMFPWVQFIPVHSRAPGTWTGSRGYVQAHIAGLALDMANTHVYACGLEAMIEAVRATTLGLGLNPKRFYSDAFLPFAQPSASEPSPKPLHL